MTCHREHGQSGTDMPLVTYGEALQSGTEYLESRKIPDAGADAWYLLEFVCSISRAEYLIKKTEEMPADACEHYRSVLKRRGMHIPLQHITGEQEFMGLSFLVDERVLIPRQDTETLVETALRRLKHAGKVLDLCTGSGCIAVSIKRLRPDGEVTASDLSGDALAVAAWNAERLEVQVRFIESDLFENISETFDLIVSNPPYIPTKVIGNLMEEVRLHDPRMALDGGEDGLLFYRKILKESLQHLNPGGWLIFEIGHDQGEAVSRMMREAGFRDVSVKKDLSGLDRVTEGRWPEEEGYSVSPFGTTKEVVPKSA